MGFFKGASKSKAKKLAKEVRKAGFKARVKKGSKTLGGFSVKITGRKKRR